MNVDDLSLRYKVEGSAVEKCMLNWLNDIGTPVFDKIVEKQRDYVLEAKLPFSPNAMKMTVAYRVTDANTGEQKIRVVMKGAPEVVVKHCAWIQQDD
jgi:magnesium-transporting ATPase (P-type)